MRLTYLAHASVLVETEDPHGRTLRLVTDPWLDGPTYLSAWWHFPEPHVDAATLGRVDYIYITHEHVDHFHVPTLERIDKTTTILIGKFMRPRFVDQLRALGFTDIRELDHGVAVPLGDDAFTVTSYQYRADDTALLIRDREGTILDLNDCLLRGGALAQVLADAPSIDLLLASFANAEGYPIVYDLDDAGEAPDWDDASRFDSFLDKVRAISPRAFSPFASMFCFLADDLWHINARIVSPAGLIARARAGEVAAQAIALDPGDRWTPRDGHERRSTIDWNKKEEILRGYQAKHRDDLAARAAREIVEGGAPALDTAFRSFFEGFARRVPRLLRSKLTLTLRLDVTGPAGGTRWLRAERGRLSFDAPPDVDRWDACMTIADWPLHRALTRRDTWQSLGISCRFRMRLRPGAREREVFLWFLLYLDDLGYLEPASLLTARGVTVLARRRRELMEYAKSLASGSFIADNLRRKFDA